MGMDSVQTRVTTTQHSYYGFSVYLIGIPLKQYTLKPILVSISMSHSVNHLEIPKKN